MTETTETTETTTEVAATPGAPASVVATPEPEITYDLKFADALAPSADLVTAFTETFKAHKLAPEAAQAVVDVLPKGLEAAQAVFQQSLEQQHAEQIKAWEAAARADPEMGGAKFDATLADAQTALGRFGDDDLRAVLSSTGIGSHPAVIRLFARINKEISEGGHVAGGQTPAAPKSVAESWYTHPTSKKLLKFG
jgi:hypothetical protein